MPDLAAARGLIRSLLIYHGRPWRRRALRRFYAGLIRPGDLVFDVGAHVGNRTRALHTLGARVVALEPQPVFHAFLCRTLPSDGITLLAEAAGAVPGTATLNISRRHPTVSTLSRDWIERVGRTKGFRRVAWDRSVEVPVTTLDRLIARFGRPAFVKIDVEGLEAEILAGLTQAPPLLAVEYLPAALHVAEACSARLAALGRYRFNLVVGEEHRFRCPEWLSPDEIGPMLTRIADDGRSGDLYARLDADDRRG